jgi:Arm DNA-binding domain
MPLTDLAIRRALPGAKIVKLSDGGGLQLWIMPDGAKRWRLAYRFGGAQKALAIGVYPEVGLKDAREARDAARKVLAGGDDPLEIKKAAKIAKADEGTNTFSAVAAELAEKKRRDKKAAATLRKFDWFMSFAFPELGSRPIHEISAREVLAVLKEVEARGTHETARKLRTAIGDVFRFAIATARADNDPTVALRGALVAPTVKPRAAIVAPLAEIAVRQDLSELEKKPGARSASEAPQRRNSLAHADQRRRDEAVLRTPRSGNRPVPHQRG